MSVVPGLFVSFILYECTNISDCMLHSTVAATEGVVPEPEAKPAATPSTTLYQKLKGRFLRSESKIKGKIIAAKEELLPTAAESASVPEAKPEKKESKAGILSKVKKSIWPSREAKPEESASAPVEETPKLPETGESSTLATEVCKCFLCLYWSQLSIFVMFTACYIDCKSISTLLVPFFCA